MGHVAKSTETRYYIGIGDDKDASAISRVPEHHRPYARIADRQEIDERATLCFVEILGADDRNDAGILRQHLAEMEANYPNAAGISKSEVGRRITQLIFDGAPDDDGEQPTFGEMYDIVRDTAREDAKQLLEMREVLDAATTPAALVDGTEEANDYAELRAEEASQQ